MRLVKREFFYWGRMTLVMTAIGLAVSAGVTVLVFLRERESWGRPEAILSWFGIYSLVIILLMLAAMAVSWFDTYLVIQLSFGCTRREAFAGFQGMKLAGAVLAGLFGSALLWAAKVGHGFLALWPVVFALALAVISLGEICGALRSWYPKLGTALVAVCGSLAGIVGGFMGTIEMGDYTGQLGYLGQLFSVLRFWLPFAAAALFLIGAILDRLVVRSVPVKL